MAVLRADLDNTRQERDRLLADNARVKEDYERIRQLGGKSIETMETLTNDKATLEVQLSTQVWELRLYGQISFLCILYRYGISSVCVMTSWIALVVIGCVCSLLDIWAVI